MQFCFWLWFVAAELAKHVPRIVLIPEGKSYKAVVPGGRVELPTPAFSGPRSTGELPRHRGSKRFYGRDAGVSIKDWISSARRVAQASACVVLNCDACCFASEKQKSKTHRLNSVLLISSTRRTRASNLSPSKLRAALFHRRDRRFRPSP